MRMMIRSPLRFLLALLVASVLWYAIAGQRRESISVRGARASLTLVNLPSGLVLTSDVPDSVSLRLSGPQSRLLDADDKLEILLDLAKAQPGLRRYPFTTESIDLPSEVSVVGFMPAEITLELEQLAIRRLPVNPPIEGVPAPGFMVASVEVNPAQVALRGPGSRLADRSEVPTEPVSVDGESSNVSTDVQVTIPDALIRQVRIEPILVTITIVPIPEPTPSPTPTPKSRRGR